MTVAKGESCVLCGCEKLHFEPPLYYCNGTGCNSARIRRNSHFYSGGRNQYHWCVPCYSEIKGEEIEIGGTVLRKSELVKEKNDKASAVLKSCAVLCCWTDWRCWIDRPILHTQI